MLQASHYPCRVQTIEILHYLYRIQAVLNDYFYIVLFSALGQTHCTQYESYGAHAILSEGKQYKPCQPCTILSDCKQYQPCQPYTILSECKQYFVNRTSLTLSFVSASTINHTSLTLSFVSAISINQSYICNSKPQLRSDFWAWKQSLHLSVK